MLLRFLASFALLVIATASLMASEVRVWGSTNTDDASAIGWASLYTVPAGLNDVTQVVVTGSTIAALRANGSVVVWGGAGDPTLTVPVGAQSGVTQIAATLFGAVYALRSDGTVIAWGNSGNQQLAVPPGLTGVSAIRGGGTQGLAIKTDGSVVGWGANYVAPNVGFTCADAYPNGVARKSDSSLVHWDSTTVNAMSLNIPPGLTGAALFSDGFRLAGVVNTSGQVTVWGSTTAGQATVPAGLTGIAELAFGGGDHVVARSTAGNLTIWGDGLTARPEIAVPIGWTGCQQIAAGYRFSVGVFAATNLGLSSTVVPFRAPANTPIGTLSVSNFRTGDTPTFSLVAGAGADDNAGFALVGSQLKTTSTTTSAPGSATFSIRIRAVNGLNPVTEQIFTLVGAADPNPPQASTDEKSGLLGGCGIGSGISLLLGSVVFALRFFWKQR